VRELQDKHGADAATFLPLDLADLESVRKAAATFLAGSSPLHGLILNAGVAGTAGKTRQGFELTMGVNHVGHFLLTQLLLERLKQSAPARVVVVASRAHIRATGLDLDGPESDLNKPLRGPFGMQSYARSKLCNVLFAKELARRLEGTGVTTYALHPGVVASEIWRQAPLGLDRLIKLFMLNNEQGAATTLRCATDEALAPETGRYYAEGKEKAPSKRAQDAALAQKLWERSEAWVR
jgi:retinol dehydrogenase-12